MKNARRQRRAFLPFSDFLSAYAALRHIANKPPINTNITVAGSEMTFLRRRAHVATNSWHRRRKNFNCT